MNLCLDCMSPRAACLVIALLTSLWNGLTALQISGLRVTEEFQDAEDSSRFQESGTRALANAAFLYSLTACLIGCAGIYGILKDHSRSMRIFALHGLIDSIVGLLMVVSLSLLAFSPQISASVGRMVCAEVLGGSRSETVSWFDFSRSAESCEERIGTIFGLTLVCAMVTLAFRAHCALVCWRYYINAWRREAFTHEMSEVARRSETKQRRSSSSSSTSSVRTLRRARSRSAESTSSSESTVCASPVSAGAPRLILLPVKGSTSSSPSPTSPTGKKASRRHTLPSSVEEEEVLVYAPVRMSLDAAQRLGGREAVYR